MPGIFHFVIPSIAILVLLGTYSEYAVRVPFRSVARRLVVALGADNDIPPVSAYERMAVCLDVTYTNPDVPPCTPDKLISFTNHENPIGAQFRYHDRGPIEMQGVFWLEDLQYTDSIASFAATPRVGGGINRGFLEEDAQGYHYRVRIRGDRTWAFATNDHVAPDSSYDSTLLFQLADGTLEQPRLFNVDGLRSVVVPIRFYLSSWFRVGRYSDLQRARTHRNSIV